MERRFLRTESGRVFCWVGTDLFEVIDGELSAPAPIKMGSLMEAEPIPEEEAKYLLKSGT